MVAGLPHHDPERKQDECDGEVLSVWPEGHREF